MAEKYAQENGLLFNEVSAKTGEGIQQIFQTIGENLYEVRKKENTTNNSNMANRAHGQVDIQLPRPSTNDSTSCCS